MANCGEKWSNEEETLLLENKIKELKKEIILYNQFIFLIKRIKIVYN